MSIELALLLLALTMVVFAAHHDDDDDSTHYGVDDDDTDASDRAGRIATNRSNNLVELVEEMAEKSKSLCPYWPQDDREDCYREVMQCLFEPLEEGELEDHLDISGSCSDNFDEATEDAIKRSANLKKKALQMERNIKVECGHDDDDCKNNIECRFLWDLAVAYPEFVELEDCEPFLGEDYQQRIEQLVEERNNQDKK